MLLLLWQYVLDTFALSRSRIIPFFQSSGSDSEAVYSSLTWYTS